MKLPPRIARLSNCWCGSGLSAWECLITSRRRHHDGVLNRLLSPLCWARRHSWDVREIVLDTRLDVASAFLFCRHCHRILLLVDEPPFEHPDCMTVELPVPDEEWLAEMAAMTWPHDERDYLKSALGRLHLTGAHR